MQSSTIAIIWFLGVSNSPPCGAMALLILFVLNLPPPATVCVGKDKAVGSIVYIFQATTITDFSLSPSLQLSSLEAEGSGPPRCSSSRGYPLSLIAHNPSPHCFQVYFILTALRRPELYLVYKTQSHGHLSSGDLLLKFWGRQTPAKSLEFLTYDLFNISLGPLDEVTCYSSFCWLVL